MLKPISQDFREVLSKFKIKKYYWKIVGNFFLKNQRMNTKKTWLYINMFSFTYNITTILHDTSK